MSEIKYERKDLPKGILNIGLPLLLIGLVSLVLGYSIDPLRASFNNLIVLMFIISVGLGAIFMVALEYLAGAVWSVPFRRIAEYQGVLFLITPLLAIPVILSMHDMYHWTHESALAEDAILRGKEPYLNEPFFYLRSIIVFVVMALFYIIFRRNSAKQDITGNQKLTKINIVFSAPFMFLFAIGITILAIDYIMSLEPHWFSTIFGVYYFAGTFLSALAVLTLLVLKLNSKGVLVNGLRKDHYYSLGALMFAFTAFWGYIAFSQYMLIWYANVPEETFWFLPRMADGWEFLSIGLIFIHFIIPFGLLINRSSKMNPGRLKFVAYWILFAHLYDLYWLIIPTYNHASDSHGPILNWMELGSVALIAGLVMVVFYFAANKKNLIAIKDPKLERGMNFHL